jgi:hypothetical protein
MSDGLSKIELKADGYGRGFGGMLEDELREDRGLLGTAPDPGHFPGAAPGDDEEAAAAAAANATSYDGGDLLPVMIENGLDKIGVL